MIVRMADGTGARHVCSFRTIYANSRPPLIELHLLMSNKEAAFCDTRFCLIALNARGVHWPGLIARMRNSDGDVCIFLANNGNSTIGRIIERLVDFTVMRAARSFLSPISVRIDAEMDSVARNRGKSDLCIICVHIERERERDARSTANFKHTIAATIYRLSTRAPINAALVTRN